MSKDKGLTIPQAIRALREADPMLCLKVDLLPIRSRTKRMLLAYATGFTLKEIGAYYNISKQRVATIFKELREARG